MIKLPEAELLDFLPSSLKNDTDMVCLSYAMKRAFERLFIYERQAMVCNYIDELPECVLDALACDLHVDWYNFSYSVNIKRAVIKNSIKIYQKMGTKYAVETALRDVYKDADTTEWFDYGGQPYHFKINVDISRDGMTENTGREITEAVKFYKNLRSHCDGIYYRLGMDAADVSAAAFTHLGGILKVKAYTENALHTADTRQLLAAAASGSILKVKARTAESITASVTDATKALAAVSCAGYIRTKAYAQRRINGARAGLPVTAGLYAADRIRVKTAVTEKLEAGTAAAVTTGYQRMKNIQAVRKEGEYGG